MHLQDRVNPMELLACPLGIKSTQRLFAASHSNPLQIKLDIMASIWFQEMICARKIKCDIDLHKLAWLGWIRIGVIN